MSPPAESGLDHALLLVPTEAERALLAAGPPRPPGLEFALVGFGPVAAAARSAQLFAAHPGRPAILIGVAGSYDPVAWPPGSALRAASVAIDGIGAGSGDRFSGPRAMGLPLWSGAGPATDAIYDRIALGDGAGGPTLLTVCAASDSPAEAARRRHAFPDAVAEDMEAFGVALAARLFGTPLIVIRGISNEAGDRDHRRWRMQEAMLAAFALVIGLATGGAPARDGT